MESNKGQENFVELVRPGVNGWSMLFVLLIVLAGLAFLIVFAPPIVKIICAVVAMVDIFLLAGLFMVNPNEGRVLQLFGKYMGTAKTPGLRWANPFYMKKKVSLRVRNFETGKMKVNDVDGNPIEIASIVVWKVVDTAEAVFHVDDYEKFVAIQSEAAVRNLTTRYQYDAHDEDSQYEPDYRPVDGP